VRISHPERRLERFWGRVDQKHIGLICRWLLGPRVLDVGCGYGTLTAAIVRDFRIECTGIDRTDRDLAIAKRLFPDCDFRHADAERLPFEDDSFSTVVLRDTLHHLVNEGDWRQIGSELLRVSAPNSRLVVFDPNVQPFLKAARRVARHRDEECTFERASEIMTELTFTGIHSGFNTVFSLPLSGGYVGIELIPNWAPVHNLVLWAERGLERLLDRLKLGRHVAWRYLIVGERSSEDQPQGRPNEGQKTIDSRDPAKAPASR
jgi:ubiquinone/menaquinone biosynthesis C-methylase UbiE